LESNIPGLQFKHSGITISKDIALELNNFYIYQSNIPMPDLKKLFGNINIQSDKTRQGNIDVFASTEIKINIP